jgi:cysteine desulfurase
MDPIYLDHAATTPLHPEVRAAMDPFLGSRFGNASSLHRWGRAARAALEDARADVAQVLGARPSEIVFVRGGTESDNLALVGSWRAARAEGRTPALAVTAIEHSAVLDAARGLVADAGAALTLLGVTPAGTLDVDALDEATDEPGAVVSVMWVNNETGLRLPVEEAVDRARGRGAVVHVDAAQAVGKVPVSVTDLPVDLLTATGHKINGPKGTGILFVREGTPLRSMLRGGGQERGVRPGTEDVAGAVGFATALRVASEAREARAARWDTWRRELEHTVLSAVPEARVNAGEGPRAPHVSSLGLPFPDGDALLAALDLEGVAVSGGSACHSGSGAGSHVVAALYGEADPLATVRFSFGHGTRQDEVRRAASTLVDVVRRSVTRGVA